MIELINGTTYGSIFDEVSRTSASAMRKAMAFADRSQIVRKHRQGSTDRAKELFAGVLLGTLIATLGMSHVLPIDALTPALATVLLTLGAATAGFALLCRRNQAGP